MVSALRRLAEDEGFTLIEVMVVVLIIAILITMGLPTFLGVRARFEDRAAESELREATVAARIIYTDAATFASATALATGLVTVEGGLCYVAAATASAVTGVPCLSGTGNVPISVAPSLSQFGAARMSTSTKCFLILDTTSGTFYGSTSTPANCTGTYAATAGNVTATTPLAGGW